MATSYNLSAQTGIETTYLIGTDTNVRDVSDVLDALYLADTPFLNRLTWGSAASASSIEWVSDNIGYGYIINSGAALASNGSAMNVGTSGLNNTTHAMRQLHTGTVLKYNGFADKSKGYLVVNDISLGGGSIGVEFLSGTVAAGSAIASQSTFFIVGSPTMEGSLPRLDTTRPRSVASNYMQTFRQDVRISGSRAAIEMYAVANELQTQIKLRAKEYMRELERSLILAHKDVGAATEIQHMGGIFDYLRGVSGSHIDTTTTSITESALLAITAELYDKGSVPNVLLMGPKQARVIPTWERARVRFEPDEHVAGFYVTKYVTDLGVTLDILISRWVPKSFAFVLDTSKIKPRAMRGRKYILEKLGKKGDFSEYQLISELSLEFKGYNMNQHGMFTALT